MTPEGADIHCRHADEAPEAARLLDRDRRSRTEPLGLVRRLIAAFAVDSRRLGAAADYENARLKVMLEPLALPMGSYFR